MVKVKLKTMYKNGYATVYPIDMVYINNIAYQWTLVATLDGVVYDTILLPPEKYELTQDTFVIYHEREHEYFERVYK